MFINVSVLGGLPIEVYVEGDEWFVVAIAGRKVRKHQHAKWIYNRVEKDECEHAALWAQIDDMTGDNQ